MSYSKVRSGSRTPLLITLYAGGGEFCDGYILSIIGVALPLIRGHFELTGGQAGLIGSASLIGMLLGGVGFGYVTDKIGRQKIYLFDIAAFIILSALQFFVDAPWQLVLLRFLMGIAIGADFAIASTLVSEFAPDKSRGPLLIMLAGMWSIGAAAAYLIGWLMTLASPDPELWRWMLASSIVPAVLILFLRFGTPESPRWLMSRGRRDEAVQALAKMGSEIEAGNLDAVPTAPTRYGDLFRPPYRRRIVFVCTFWGCQLLPIYAISTYEPQILHSFGLGGSSTLGAVVLQVFYVIATLTGALFINRGRRRVLLISFTVAAIALIALGVWPQPSVPVVIGLFIVFGFGLYSAQGLEALYPSELFPTHIRATARGFATGVSRIGAAIGTFGAPLLLEYDRQLAMIVGGLVCVVGLATSYFLAPETRGMSLEQASGDHGMAVQDPTVAVTERSL